jgi:hypothetical protein
VIRAPRLAEVIDAARIVAAVASQETESAISAKCAGVGKVQRLALIHKGIG